MLLKKIVIFFLFFLWFSTNVSAQVVINEMGTQSSPDWVEIYNVATKSADLSLYKLEDSGNNVKNLSGIIQSFGFATFDWSNRLNNDGDTIKLVRISDNYLVDKITYGGLGNVCVPSTGESVGRYPDANSIIDRFQNSTKGLSNNSAILNPCPTPTPEPTATFTPTPTSKPTATPKPTTTPIPIKAPTLKLTVKPTKMKITVAPIADNDNEKEGEALGIQDKNQNIPTPADDLEDEGGGKKFPVLAGVFIVGGLGFMGAAVYPFLKTKKRTDILYK